MALKVLLSLDISPKYTMSDVKINKTRPAFYIENREQVFCVDAVYSRFTE